MPKYFIAGGSGTLGTELVRQLHTTAERIVVFSRDEQKQYEMAKVFPEGGKRGLRYMIGDIRSVNRLAQAMRGCDYVIHAAAMKHVPACEYNPQEAIETNVQGSRNVVDACNLAGIRKCMVISTDKAVHPINLYGATKLCMEKLTIAANNLGKCRFSVCRYGNVEGSKGSVIPHWRKLAELGQPIPITDKRMTRFWISIEDAAKFVIHKIRIMQGGEIFIPEIKNKSMLMLAKEICPNAETIETGIRPGEKLHECLISEEDARFCFHKKGFYTVYPMFHYWASKINPIGSQISENFRMTSDRCGL
jgi:UDP-N-acetylglucosamine 4,6-dehydratase